MLKKLFKTITLTTAMTMILAVTSYAASDKITSVSVSFNEEKSEPGIINNVEVTESSSKYEIISVDVSRSYEDWRPGKKVTFTILLEPTEDYYFNKKDTKVKVSGAELSSETIKSKSIEIRANYFPEVTLEAPQNIYFEDEYLAVWDEVEYASMYEVKIYKDDSYYKTVKTKDNEIDLSNYATGDEYITFEVRAVAKDSDESKYLKNSSYVSCDEEVFASDNTTYGKFTGNYDNYRFIDLDGNYAQGWQFINGSWYYFDPYSSDKKDRAIQSNWALINDKWYYFNEYCIMQTGWLKLNNEWYYLNYNGDMATGWLQTGPNGPWYYFNDSGVMLHDTTTPDGYYVNSNGEWWE